MSQKDVLRTEGRNLRNFPWFSLRVFNFRVSLIVRAHQVVEDGYQFFSKRALLTLFSAANYCGEFDNAGAVMSVSEDLTCCFSILPVLNSIEFSNDDVLFKLANRWENDMHDSESLKPISEIDSFFLDVIT